MSHVMSIMITAFYGDFTASELSLLCEVLRMSSINPGRPINEDLMKEREIIQFDDVY